MKIIIYIISTLISVDCLSQVEIDTVDLYNGYVEVEEKESNKIVKSLFNQNGQLIRIKYGELKGNPKSEWCCPIAAASVHACGKVVNSNKLLHLFL